MSKILLCLGCVALTLGIVSVWGGPTDASDVFAPVPAGHASVIREGGDPHAGLILQIAQKKIRKKAASQPGDLPAPKGDLPEKGAEPAPGEEGSLKFSKDVAPILVANCVNCHKEGGKGFQKTKLDMTTYEKLKKGATGEVVIIPGKPEESVLYLRVTGEETPRMPPGGGNNQLADSAIERIGLWIKEGARLDPGLDPKAMLASYAFSPSEIRQAELAKRSPEERDKFVDAKALERWKKGSPKLTPELVPGKTLLLVGALPKARATTIVRTLEPVHKQVRSLVGQQGDPLEKVGLYVFNDRTSFVEFARSVEKKELEPGDVGIANLGIEAPFVAVLDPQGGRDEPPAAPKTRRSKKASEDDSMGSERTLAGILAEQLAIGEVKRAGEVPSWLSQGLGAFFASRIDPRSLYIHRLRKNAYDLADQGWVANATEAMGGDSSAEKIRSVGLGIVGWMATDPRARQVFPEFVQAMTRRGAKHDDVIGQVFNGARQDLLQYSGEYVMAGQRR